ncbi:unnamed protein product [Mytilus coruscus]|uniref:DDE Tnp4 domain-containing protein n=1 Tax=Mytilus coruscus TaxID=42192 RepID=A0A6J8CI12_MYTCO|nr:unnamed protein product [Mytilus coruscus]
MANFRLLAAMDEEIEDELLLLSCYKDNSNSGDAFNFDELSAEACKKLFRFEKDDIPNYVQPWVSQILLNTLTPLQLEMHLFLIVGVSLMGPFDPYVDRLQISAFCFNGHKRVHAIKFQSIVSPNGLVANMYGPIESRRHDAGLLRESGICGELQTHMTTPTGDIYVIYGDPAYPMTTHIIKPFRGGVISAAQARFNKKMSAVRTCVEWTFGKILTLFAFLDYKKNLKLYLQPVGKYYLVGTILVNCHTCLYGSETGHYFDIDPRSLENYLSG